MDIGCAIEKPPSLDSCFPRGSSAPPLGHSTWHLPLSDIAVADRAAVGDESKFVDRLSPRCQGEFGPEPTEAITGDSQVRASCRRSDAHLFGFSKLPRRHDMCMTQDGTTYRVVRRSENEGGIGFDPSDTI